MKNRNTEKETFTISNGHKKPVAQIRPVFRVFDSVEDAAAAMETAPQNMSSYLNRRRGQHIKGAQFCFLNELNQYLNELAENSQSLASENSANREKARLWDEHQAQQAAIAKARREHEERVAKANEKLVRRNRIVERLEAELAEAIARRDEAVSELNELNGREVG